MHMYTKKKSHCIIYPFMIFKVCTITISSTIMIESEKVNTISPIDAKFHMIQNFIVRLLKQTNKVAVEQYYQTLERCNMLKY